MTGTSSNRGALFTDFDSFKHQEWLRRRKLRIEQVRKQSIEMAKSLRRKVVNEEKTRAEEHEKMRETQLKSWKAQRLSELERKLRGALVDFGKGHKLAEVESDPEEVLQTKNQINMEKAQKRGELAQQEELKRKKVEEEKVMSSINRKIMTRKVEDLRSALVCSIPVQKQLIQSSGDQEAETPIMEGVTEGKSTITKKRVPKTPGNIISQKIVVKKPRIQKALDNQQISEKLIKSKFKDKENYKDPPQEGPTVWINLNEIQTSSVETGSKPGSSKTDQNCKEQRGKMCRTVEFYDYPSRYYCKSFREFPDLVEKIDSWHEPDANELSRMEEEREMKEVGKKLEADVISLERGAEALRRERTTRDYNKLISKLEELNKKEKLLKTQQRVHNSLIYMNDERLSEKRRTKQRIMDSKFESIFYVAATEVCPVSEDGRSVFDRTEMIGDYVAPGTPIKLSFSPSNLKNHSPVTPCYTSEPSSGDSFVEQTRSPVARIKSKNKKKLLSDIDKALRKGRKLRKTVCRTRLSCDSKSLEENSESETKESETSRTNPSAEEHFPSKKTVKSQDRESEMKDLSCDNIDGSWELECKTGDDSLPMSTSTSYRSPPSVINSCRLRQFLDYLEIKEETNGNFAAESDHSFRKKVKKMLKDLINETNSEEEEETKSCQNGTLRYYILKLLGMSREHIADLSVSSENISTPNAADLDKRNNNSPRSKSPSSSENSFKVCPEREDLNRERMLKRAEELEQSMKNWKIILENNIEENRPMVSVPEDKPDFARPFGSWAESEIGCDGEIEEEKVEPEEEPKVDILCSPRFSSKYEKITRKCSDRISELSDMLDKVRKDKEKLLNSTSGASSVTFSKDERIFEKSLFRTKEKESPGREKRCLEGGDAGNINRYGWLGDGKENVSTAAVAGSQSFPEDLSDSPESLPDAMEELFKRKILSSPFKWTEGEKSLELIDLDENSQKPSSIETVIGNFRKEISKIKPFSQPSTDAFSSSKARYFSSAKEKSEEPSGSPERRSFFPDFESESEHISFSKAFAYEGESSVDSINHALTSLGLNWAKSFLKKNEESRAISSSSGSDQDKASLD